MNKVSELRGYNGIFASKLRKLMKGNKNRKKTKNFTLAKALGVSYQSISGYTTGSALPNIEVLYLMSKYFNVSADYLIFDTETKETDDHEIKKIKIEDFEMSNQYVTKVEMNVDTEKPPTFKIMLEVPFSRDLLKNFIFFQ